MFSRKRYGITSAGQHMLAVWCLRLLTGGTAALSQLSVCAPGCQVNKQAGAKWVRVEMRALPWRRANTSPPAPRHHHHHHYCTLLRMLLHNTNTAILLFLFTRHNIDTVVQRFHFSHYCKQSHGGALLAHSSSRWASVVTVRPAGEMVHWLIKVCLFF